MWPCGLKWIGTLHWDGIHSQSKLYRHIPTDLPFIQLPGGNFRTEQVRIYGEKNVLSIAMLTNFGSDNIEIGGFYPLNLVSGEHVLFLASFHNNDVTLSQFQVMITLLQSFIESMIVVLPYSPVGYVRQMIYQVNLRGVMNVSYRYIVS